MTRHPQFPMRLRAGLLAGAVAFFVAGTPAPADAQQSVPPQIVQQLQEQGFTILSARRTWLGRVRVVARSGRHEREIVYVPATGEILRDYWEDLDDDRTGDRDRRDDDDSDGDDSDDDDGKDDDDDDDSDDNGDDDSDDDDDGDDGGDDNDDDDDDDDD